MEKIFLYKIWIKIWELNNWVFEVDFYFWTLEKFEKNSINIDEENLNLLLRGEEIESKNILELSDKVTTKELFFQICIENKPAWIIKIKNWKIKSLISTKAMRK